MHFKQFIIFTHKSKIIEKVLNVYDSELLTKQLKRILFFLANFVFLLKCYIFLGGSKVIAKYFLLLKYFELILYPQSDFISREVRRALRSRINYFTTFGDLNSKSCWFNECSKHD